MDWINYEFYGGVADVWWNRVDLVTRYAVGFVNFNFS